MTENISVHLKKFNDRVKVLNQTRAKDLTLSADDARNLQAEIFSLLAQISYMAEKIENFSNEDSAPIEVKLDGGAWK